MSYLSCEFSMARKTNPPRLVCFTAAPVASENESEESEEEVIRAPAARAGRARAPVKYQISDSVCLCIVYIYAYTLRCAYAVSATSIKARVRTCAPVYVADSLSRRGGTRVSCMTRKSYCTACGWRVGVSIRTLSNKERVCVRLPASMPYVYRMAMGGVHMRLYGS